ncbi:MAG: hypothetical protein QNJ47_02595 [Nostocaceae cyanobacterium]|nr:hypothetical protein [Nostocaceae cyanobacterium]
MPSLRLILGITLITFSSLPAYALPQENTSIPKASEAPLELELLTKPENFVITANTIRQEKLTVPSLWWAKENSENKLLDNWIAYPPNRNQSARIDLVVNQQIWNILDYLERYNFVNRIGNLARTNGYNLRVFNYQKDRLATYTCSFKTIPNVCKIEMSYQNNMSWKPYY